MPEVYRLARATTVDANIGILVSFDGASRHNPGAASYGVCAWWGLWDAAGFQSKGLMLCSGKKLGHATNNVAEARGMAAAVKEITHLLMNASSLLADCLKPHS